jgi:hypothetical protein
VPTLDQNDFSRQDVAFGKYLYNAVYITANNSFFTKEMLLANAVKGI